MGYRLHLDYLNIDINAYIVESAMPISLVDWDGYFWMCENTGNSFNLYDWIKNNFLPNVSSGTTVKKSLFTFNYSGETTISCFITLEKVDDTTVNIGLSTYNYDISWWIQYRYGLRPSMRDVDKYLNILIFKPYQDTVGLHYNITPFIGHFGYMQVGSSPYNPQLIRDYLYVSEIPYINELYWAKKQVGIISGHNGIGSFTTISSTNFNIYETISNIEETSNNPEDDYSGEGGGKGVVDDRSDYVPTDGVPLVSGIRSGFVNLYAPTLAQIKSLHDFLMGDSFLNNVKKLIANPIDYIISLHLLPLHPTTDGSESIAVGGIDTLVTMPIIPTQYMEFDCGTLNLNEYWGSFIDYSPFTKVSIFLPFVGIKELNLDDVMAGQIKVIYRIDVLTGNFTCSLHVISSRKVNAVLYNYSGNMSMSMPISAIDYRQKVSAFTQLVGSGAMVAVSGGASPSADIGFASNLANVALSKYGYSRSGNITGDASLLGNYTPYLIISRPNQSLPSKYKGLNGYTSNIGGTVGQFSGYNAFREVKTDGLTCLEEEKQMIVDLLQSGVFV